MNCETLHERLLDFVDGALDEAAAAACRAHVATCAACARAVAHHRATAQLLGELPPLGEGPSEAMAPARLRQMAATVLARARAEPATDVPAAPPLGPPSRPSVPLPRPPGALRRLVRFATAAVVVLSAAFGTRLLLRDRADPSPGDEPPPFVSDPDFVGNFEVLRDMSVADSTDGDLLDLDHDDVLMLQLLEDA